jgi:aryl-alcohol dehydrogenase-like predicted oxidoreductase/adenylate kinase family enzyme
LVDATLPGSIRRVAWLDPAELRIGLGCLRLPADEETACATLTAAASGGITVFDTAHAYGATPGGGEQLLARVLGSDTDPGGRARIITKGGMARPSGGWVPDGRAKTITADCEASLTALDGREIDLYLLHAPDPRMKWETSVRALARLVDRGLVRRIGVANVNRTQLDQALELAPIAAVQVALNPLDDRAIRGGVLERCDQLGLTLLAHSPLGGPPRAQALLRRGELTVIACAHGAAPAEVALAWLLSLSPSVVPIPGASRPESARSSTAAATLELDEAERATLTAAFWGAAPPARRSAPRGAQDGEVVIVMGIPGAGKSQLAADYVDRGHARLNRDERGGSLRGLAAELDTRLAGGVRRAVLDNTYLTRESRNRVIETATRHALPTRCVWIDTPLAQAQVNLVLRLLERFGSLPTPEQIRVAAKREPWLMLPTSQMRALQELEPPSADEGFTAIEHVSFARTPASGASTAAVFVGAAALTCDDIADVLARAEPAAPHLLFDWVPDGDTGALDVHAARLRDLVTGPVEVALCPHASGPPPCWCRPPLPGLPLAFARARSTDLARATLIGCTPTHRTLGRTLGARYVSAANRDGVADANDARLNG